MPAGRPRAFDIDTVTDRAMLLFWQQGYDGTSLAELKDTLGMSSSSFYATFSSKVELFERALTRYVSTWGAVTEIVDDAGLTGREAVSELLHRSIEMQTDVRHPPGCLVALSNGLVAEQTPKPVLDAVIHRREHDRSRIQNCIERAIESGELRPDVDAAALTSVVHGLLLGLSVQIRDGAAPASLHAGIDAALQIWDAFTPRPTPPSRDRGGR